MTDIILNEDHINFTQKLFQKEEPKVIETFQIIDEKNLITKRQRKKIKQWCKENEYNQDKILEQIHYKGPVVYNKINKQWSEKENVYKLFFIYEKTEKELLRDRLKDKIKNFREKRYCVKNYSEEDQKKKKMWDFYYKIKNLPQVQKIPANMIDIALPTPENLIIHREDYLKQYDKIPNCCIKDYFKLCLF